MGPHWSGQIPAQPPVPSRNQNQNQNIFLHLKISFSTALARGQKYVNFAHMTVYLVVWAYFVTNTDEDIITNANTNIVYLFVWAYWLTNTNENIKQVQIQMKIKIKIQIQMICTSSSEHIGWQRTRPGPWIFTFLWRLLVKYTFILN